MNETKDDLTSFTFQFFGDFNRNAKKIYENQTLIEEEMKKHNVPIEAANLFIALSEKNL